MGNKIKDIEGQELHEGDEVYYSRKQSYHNSGELLKLNITKIDYENEIVRLGKYISMEPNRQLLKKKK